MELIVFTAIGWVAALSSRIIVPSPRNMGLIRTLLVGMVGSIFGGIVGGTFNQKGPLFALATPSLTGAVLGGLMTVFVVLFLNRQRAY
jgi:uncharacterized membrane protein YeaQ/YmgE (transglycosylase-associated protein family)